MGWQKNMLTGDNHVRGICILAGCLESDHNTTRSRKKTNYNSEPLMNRVRYLSYGEYRVGRLKKQHKQTID